MASRSAAACSTAGSSATPSKIRKFARPVGVFREGLGAVDGPDHVQPFGHFAETLDAMDEFTTQFEKVRLRSGGST